MDVEMWFQRKTATVDAPPEIISATPAEPDRVEAARLKMAEAEAALGRACKEKRFFREMHGIRMVYPEVFYGCRHQSSRLIDVAREGWLWHVQNVGRLLAKFNAATAEWAAAKEAAKTNFCD
jgi:hypothetical protein